MGRDGYLNNIASILSTYMKPIYIIISCHSIKRIPTIQLPNSKFESRVLREQSNGEEFDTEPACRRCKLQQGKQAHMGFPDSSALRAFFILIFSLSLFFTSISSLSC